MSPKIAAMLTDVILPKLQKRIALETYKWGLDDGEELLQEALLISAKMLVSLERSGKTPKPGSIAFYTVKRLKVGRRSRGSNRVDAMSPETQQRGRARVYYISGDASQEASGNGQAIDQTTQPQNAGFWVDVDFITRNDIRLKRAIQYLIKGYTVQETARIIGEKPKNLRNLLRAKFRILR